MKRKIILYITLGLLYTGEMKAQPGGQDGGGPNPVNPAPIGGLEYLLLAGGALGIKKIISNKKKKNNE